MSKIFCFENREWPSLDSQSYNLCTWKGFLNQATAFKVGSWIVPREIVFFPVLRIRDILVRVQICGSVPLTNGSDSGSGSCFFLSDLTFFPLSFFACYFLNPEPDPQHWFFSLSVFKASPFREVGKRRQIIVKPTAVIIPSLYRTIPTLTQPT